MVKRYTGDLLLRNGIPQERKEYEGTYAERLAYSTDGLRESDMWLEIDTGKVYFWSETANGWVTGSGGGGGAEKFIVTVDRVSSSEATSDKTFDEIVEAVEAGKIVECKVTLNGDTDTRIHDMSINETQKYIYFYGFSTMNCNNSEDLTSAEFYMVTINEDGAVVKMPFLEP